MKGFSPKKSPCIYQKTCQPVSLTCRDVTQSENTRKTQHNSPVNMTWWSFHLGILHRGEYWTSAEPTALLLLPLTYSGMHKKPWNPTSNPTAGFPQDYRKTSEEAAQIHLGRWLNPGEISEGRNLIQGYHEARITIKQALTFIHLSTVSLSPKPVWRDQIALDSVSTWPCF